MSIPKIVGIETEFAIVDGEPQRASTEVVRAYRSISLDSKNNPLTAPDNGNPCAQLSSDADLMLPNGARLYVDHAHPEYSTPETTDPRVAVALERAGAEILRRCCARVNENRPAGAKMRLYKNNSDFQGNSYGCHENYLLDARTFSALFETALSKTDDAISDHLIPFLCSRIVLTGAGKVGAENGTEPVDFQISQRADFLEELVGLQTTFRRPIVNTRDEPHADASRFRRLHVIPGDANMCPYAAWLKLGTMQIFLKMLEDRALGESLRLSDPISAVRRMSRDPGCTVKVRLENGTERTAVEIQSAFLDSSISYFQTHPCEEWERKILDAWGDALKALEEDRIRLVGKLDWVTKERLVSEIGGKEGWSWASPMAQESDFKYHALDPEESLYCRLEDLGMIDFPPGWGPDDEAKYVKTPPEDSRAYFRGRCIEALSDRIIGIDWEKIDMKDGRLEMPDPLSWNKNVVEAAPANPGENAAVSDDKSQEP